MHEDKKLDKGDGLVQYEHGQAEKKSEGKWHNAYKKLAFGLGCAGLIVGIALITDRALQPRIVSALSETSQAQIVALEPTLNSGQAQEMTQHALACQIPLANVAIWHDPGVIDAPVRIKSGGYLSPSFMLTDVPEVIAIPYPAPYASGAGTLMIMGDAKDVEVSLTPTVAISNVVGAATVHVVWRTGNPCA